MKNFFDKAVHYLGKNCPDTFIINIGAMDGVMFDELVGYTNTYKFKGIYVEPIPYLFEKLKNNMDNGDSIFENSAISDYNGEIEMLTIDKDVIDKGLVHSCFYGMSAVFPPKNGLGSEGDKLTVEKYGQKINVKCITFEKLLRKNQITKFDIVKIDAEGHDYIIFKQIDFDEFRPQVVRVEWINLNENEQKLIIKTFEKYDYVYEVNGQDIVGIPNELYSKIFGSKESKNNSEKNYNITLVTGIWDIGRGELNEGWSRPFQHYLDKFLQLLSIDVNMIIFGDSELQEFVIKHRKNENTQFILRDLNWFKNNNYYDLIQKIRNEQSWYNQAGWLTESTQAKLEMYNPLVMSKMFLLNDAKILDKFDSTHLMWIDGGITNTVHIGYFTHDMVLSKLKSKLNKFSFISFPYDGKVEIHGFEYKKMCEYSNSDVNMVCRGGFFGGPKETINDINSIYYGLLLDTLSNGFMGTEESIFTIMAYKHSDMVQYFEIENNGLIGKFFEDCKNNSLLPKSVKNIMSENTLDTDKTALYVITFNSPNQLRTLIKSMQEYDKNFLDKPKKFILNNSTDRSTDEDYKVIAQEQGFGIIWPEKNLGITGGRQFIAEHFETTGLDYYFFFEDDMFFYNGPEKTCKNGFNRKIDNLYDKVLDISKKEDFGFLKMNFTEFYGDNSTQWSWYNVPQVFRESHWPEKPSLPVQGLDPEAPRTNFKNIKSYKGVPYATGEVYLCNWPVLFSKSGNYKCYLETKYASPFEQTIMSHNFQETIKGNLKPGLLLMTPTEHDRFEHYDASLRKEC